MTQTYTDAERYEMTIDRIRAVVDRLNRELGIDLGDWDTPKITFGYIGNCERWGDDRSWSVFLPHPNRVGTDDDRIGGFRTGDLDGARRVLTALTGFRKGIQFAGGAAMAEIRYRKAARIATD